MLRFREISLRAILHKEDEIEGLQFIPLIGHFILSPAPIKRAIIPLAIPLGDLILDLLFDLLSFHSQHKSPL